MCSVVVIEVQVRRQKAKTSLRGRIREAVSPLTKERLDHSFGFAVGARSVGTSADVFDAERTARGGEEGRSISVAIVGEQSSNDDAALGEPSHGSTKECDCGPLSLVAEHFDVGQSRLIIDAHVRELPARSWSMSTIAGDPMPDSIDASKLFDVDVK